MSAYWLLLLPWALGVVPIGALAYRAAAPILGRSDGEFFAVIGGLFWPITLTVVGAWSSLNALKNAMVRMSGLHR